MDEKLTRVGVMLEKTSKAGNKYFNAMIRFEGQEMALIIFKDKEDPNGWICYKDKPWQSRPKPVPNPAPVSRFEILDVVDTDEMPF